MSVAKHKSCTSGGDAYNRWPATLLAKVEFGKRWTFGDDYTRQHFGMYKRRFIRHHRRDRHGDFSQDELVGEFGSAPGRKYPGAKPWTRLDGLVLGRESALAHVAVRTRRARAPAADVGAEGSVDATLAYLDVARLDLFSAATRVRGRDETAGGPRPSSCTASIGLVLGRACPFDAVHAGRADAAVLPH